MNHKGLVLVFRTYEALVSFAIAEKLSLEQKFDPAFFNLDVVEKWLSCKRPAQLDCVAFLNAWNLLADLSESIGGSFDPDKDKTRKIYSKLFWGNNLPAVTPAGKHYKPLWPGQESRIIRQVLRHGLSLLRQQTAPGA